jgi:hypothetical protein
MRVKSINVTGLFGVFNHEIPINSAERLTIIHGPNGFGKTVMLRMIAAVAEGTTAIFQQTPFDEFSLTFEDGTARIIRRTLGEKTESSGPVVKLEYLIRDQTGNIAPYAPQARTIFLNPCWPKLTSSCLPLLASRENSGWSARLAGYTPCPQYFRSFREQQRLFPRTSVPRASFTLPKTFRFSSSKRTA